MAKRKYTRWGEKAVRNECTKSKCKWQGTDEEKNRNRLNDYQEELVCPKCGNNEFYGLLF
jgi:cytochrome c-type biogenesis protein CcmH/NrfF